MLHIGNAKRITSYLYRDLDGTLLILYDSKWYEVFKPSLSELLEICPHLKGSLWKRFWGFFRKDNESKRVKQKIFMNKIIQN